MADTGARDSKAILVLGMHRSGTSAFTRVLSLLGADLPGGLLPANRENEKGYWESKELVQLHDEYLAVLGSTWEDPGPLPDPPLGSTAAAACRAKILALVEREFSGSSLFVVKDPRMCRLVPLWLSILESFAAEPLFVLALRHPLEVAESLAARGGFSRAKSHLLWLRHVLEAERHSRGYRRSIVDFGELLVDWSRVAGQMGSDLGLRWPKRPEAVAARVERFLSDSLRHHRCDLSDLHPERQPLGPWIRRVYATLVEKARDPAAVATALDAVHSELQTADGTLEPALAEQRRREAQRTQRLEGELAELRRQEAERTQRLEAELAELRRLHSALEGELSGLRAELTETRGELTETRGELAETRGEVAAALAERMSELEATLAEARRRLDMLWSSKPWRLYLGAARIKRALGRRSGRGRVEERPAGGEER